MNTHALIASTAQTMSSVELVAIINKIRKEENTEYTILEHSDFLKKVVKVLGVSAGNLSGTYKDSQNKERPCYNLPKRECHLMVMSESYKIQAAVYDRMTELEQADKPAFTLPDFTDPAEAAIAWAAEFKAKREAEALVESQKEVIQKKDDLIIASNEASIKAGEILIREFVKSQDLVDIGERKFFKWMREQKFVFLNKDGVNEPYQPFVKAGYFTFKPSDNEMNGVVRYTLRVTPRGKIWLSSKYMAYLDSVGWDIVAPSNELILLNGGAA
jgi:anti-repressor protein